MLIYSHAPWSHSHLWLDIYHCKLAFADFSNLTQTKPFSEHFKLMLHLLPQSYSHSNPVRKVRLKDSEAWEHMLIVVRD